MKGNRIIKQVIDLPKGAKIANVKIEMKRGIMKDGVFTGKDIENLEKKLDILLNKRKKRLNTLRTQLNEETAEFKELERVRNTNLVQKRKRFNILHKAVKSALLYPILFIMQRRMKKYLIQSEKQIPKDWNNNLQRMWYYSFMKGIDDMWIYMHREMNQHWKAQYKTPSEYLRVLIKGWRYYKADWGRRSLINIWITEILEDSIDREWFNMSILNLTHEVMNYYKVSAKQRAKVPKAGKYPVFCSGIEFDPKYMVENMLTKVWKEPEVFDYDKQETETIKKEGE